MKISALIYRARGRLNDFGNNPLWEDPELAIYADEGYTEMARITRCIRDHYTATGARAMCTIPIIKDKAEYTLNKYILDIYSIKHTALTQPLVKASEAELDMYYHDWWNATDKYPTYFVLNRKAKELRLVPIPNEDDTGSLKLSISRLPIESLLPYSPTDSDKEPEDLREEWHQFLVYYMLYMAYSKDDVATYNEKKAATNLVIWENKLDQVKRDILRYEREDRPFVPHPGVL